MSRPRHRVAPLLLLGLIWPVSGWAQNYPAKVVRYLVPTPAGSGADTIGRVMAGGLAQVFGQQVVVDNRPGGGNNIGAEIAAKRPRTVEQVPGALALGCDPGAGCRRRT